MKATDLGSNYRLVEDDSIIGESIRQGLRKDGFAVDWVRDGRAAELALTRNPATREVTFRGEPVSLSAHEFALLAAFLDRPGAVLSREQLEEKLYGWDQEVGSNTVSARIGAVAFVTLGAIVAITCVHLDPTGWRFGKPTQDIVQRGRNGRPIRHRRANSISALSGPEQLFSCLAL